MKKNIVKKIVAITFAVAMALTISPMAKAATSDQQAERYKQFYRGDEWKTPANPEIDNSLRAIVDKATADFSEEVFYAPVALLAERQGEGQDYRVFCRRTEMRPGAKAVYSIIEIHENLIGEAVLADIIDQQGFTSGRADAACPGGKLRKGRFRHAFSPRVRYRSTSSRSSKWERTPRTS